MISKKLQRARDFEKKYGPYVAEELPKFHVTAPIGWINDPNGFAPYKGEYHLFYQNNPYEVKWGPMHWGHVKTRDFIKWERLPIAMAPDMDYDKDGCFSGGAVEMPDGRHLLMYTGVRSVRRKNGKVDNFQTQCIAIGDGVNYEKYEGNPVIRSEDVPESGSVHDFRDPKIWREDGMYSFDPNLRPPLWENLEDAREAIAWGLSQCDILKIADNELEFMTGEKSFGKGAAILQEKYPNIKVLNVTAGADGSYSFYGEEAPVFVPSCKLGGVIETTGAGDTFCASVLNFVLENGITGLTEKDREDMLRFANTAAYIVTTRKGAIRAMPEKEQVLELMKKP